MKSYRFTKDIVAHIAYVVQLGILTGTDIAGMLMAMVVDVDEETGDLKLNQDYLNSIHAEVEEMVRKAEAMANQNNENDPPGFL